MPNLKESDLAHFTGTEIWFKHNMVPRITYTQGVQYVAEHGGAYWLIDAIVFSQMIAKVAAEPFQVWKLKVKEDSSATLTCEDGNGNVVHTNDITWTDFPFSIDLWMTNDVILLPSEY